MNTFVPILGCFVIAAFTGHTEAQFPNGFNFPNIQNLPNFNFPNIPNFNFPNIPNLPNFNFPSIPNLPNFNFPNVPNFQNTQNLPNFNFPSTPDIPKNLPSILTARIPTTIFGNNNDKPSTLVPNQPSSLEPTLDVSNEASANSDNEDSEGVKCYVCQNCAVARNLIRCPSGVNQCLQSTAKVSGVAPVVTRSCGGRGHANSCIKLDVLGTSTETCHCTGDACNGSGAKTTARPENTIRSSETTSSTITPTFQNTSTVTIATNESTATQTGRQNSSSPIYLHPTSSPDLPAVTRPEQKMGIKCYVCRDCAKSSSVIRIETCAPGVTQCRTTRAENFRKLKSINQFCGSSGKPTYCLPTFVSFVLRSDCYCDGDLCNTYGLSYIPTAGATTSGDQPEIANTQPNSQAEVSSSAVVTTNDETVAQEVSADWTAGQITEVTTPTMTTKPDVDSGNWTSPQVTNKLTDTAAQTSHPVSTMSSDFNNNFGTPRPESGTSPEIVTKTSSVNNEEDLSSTSSTLAFGTKNDEVVSSSASLEWITTGVNVSTEVDSAGGNVTQSQAYHVNEDKFTATSSTLRFNTVTSEPTTYLETSSSSANSEIDSSSSTHAVEARGTTHPLVTWPNSESTSATGSNVTTAEFRPITASKADLSTSLSDLSIFIVGVPTIARIRTTSISTEANVSTDVELRTSTVVSNPISRKNVATTTEFGEQKSTSIILTMLTSKSTPSVQTLQSTTGIPATESKDKHLANTVREITSASGAQRTQKGILIFALCSAIFVLVTNSELR